LYRMDSVWPLSQLYISAQQKIGRFYTLVQKPFESAKFRLIWSRCVKTI
jgi:hypothetical protein